MSEEERKQQKKRGGCLKWVLIIFGVLILLGACGALLGGEDNATNTTPEEAVEETDDTSTDEASEEDAEQSESDEQEESASEEEEVVEEEDADDIVGLSTPLNVGDVEFTVNNWEQASSVGSDFMTEEANDTYIVMDVTVVNNSSEAITVDSSYFKIVNGENTYEPDTMASSTANEDGLGLFFEQINPGSSRNALVVFDVTQDVVDSNEKQVQVQSGIWGTETGLINLQ